MPAKKHPQGDCPTRIVSDLPAEEDAFGAHQKLADALGDLLECESGGRVVGLSGRWGSGKSTVVRLLANRFEMTSEGTHAIWVFDAWAHEGDLLRRTFLEELVSYLCDHGWLNRQIWKKKLDELSGRRQSREERVYPRLSGVGLAAAMLLLLVPVGYVILGHALDTGVTLRLTGTPHWGAVVGLLLMLSPVLAALLLIGTHILMATLRTLFRKEPFSLPDFRVELAPLVQGKVTSTQTETIQTPATSSVEFERAFSDIMAEALADDHRRLTIVIDNLDRVASGDALRIWSTLQTFLQPKAAPPAWLGRLWIVMPYDPDSIVRLWESDGDSGEIASSFLDKTFQVNVDVPPPLLSDWRDYLFQLLEYALPEHGEDEFHAIYRLFAISRGYHVLPPTPRELKLFVNQLGMLHRQRGHDMPLVHQAYYSLQRRRKIDVRAQLLSGALPREEDLGLLGDGVSDSLAALEFGVGVERARQLLLSEPIAEALSTGDHEGLAKLEKNHPGFQAVLEQVFTRYLPDWRRGESTKVLQSMVTLTQSGVLKSSGKHVHARCIEEIRGAAEKVETWTPFDWRVPGLALLAEEVGDARVALRLAASYTQSVSREQPPDSETEARERALAALDVARAFDDLCGDDDPFPSGIGFPGSMELFCAGLYAIASEVGEDPDSRDCYLLVPMAEPAAITQFFETSISTGGFGIKHFLALRSVLRTGPPPDAPTLATALQNRISAGNTGDPHEVNALVGALEHLPKSAADSPLRSLAESGHFAHHVDLAMTAGSWITVAQCVVAHARKFPDLSARGGAGQSAAGYNQIQEILTSPREEFVQHFVELLTNYQCPELLFEILDENSGSAPLVGMALTEILKRDAQMDFLEPTNLVTRWSSLAPYLDIGDFVGSWSRTDELAKAAIDAGFSNEKMVLYGKLLTAQERPQDFAIWCVESLGNLDEVTWLGALREPADILAMTTQLAEHGYTVELEGSLRTALLKYASEVCGGGAVNGVEGAKLVRLLGRGEREVFRDELVDVAGSRSEGLPLPFIVAFGEELALAERLRTENSVVTAFFEPLVASRDPDSLKWLADYAAADPKFLDSFKESYRRLFRKRVREELRDGPDEEAREHLSSLAKTLRIKGSALPAVR